MCNIFGFLQSVKWHGSDLQGDGEAVIYLSNDFACKLSHVTHHIRYLIGIVCDVQAKPLLCIMLSLLFIKVYYLN